MVFDPLTTFVIYVVGILVVMTVMAFIADRWEAKVARDARRQARAEARAKLREEMMSLRVEPL